VVLGDIGHAVVLIDVSDRSSRTDS
jgi:hypothetical protein